MGLARISARTGRRLGTTLMVSSLAVGILTPFTAVAVDEVPEDRTTVEFDQVVRAAFWNGDSSETAPTAVTKQFPPEAACLVAPQACSFPTGDDDPSSELPTGQLDPFAEEGEESEDGLGSLGNSLIDGMNEQYGDGVDQVQENDPGAPAEPVPDRSLPVSIAFGQAYYRSAIEFPLPEVAEGDKVDDFIVLFEQGNPTFSNSSPALRQAVLATLTCARPSDSNPTGRCETEEFEKVSQQSCGDGSDQCLQDGSPLPFQLCPIAEDPVTGEANVEWTADGPQDEDTLPTANCLFGSQGTTFEIDGTTFWAFDLALALNAWNDGTIPYEGMIFMPGSAANFAFGDAETTFSKQVTLRSENISYAAVTSPKPAPPAPFVPPTPAGGTSQPQPQATAESPDLFGTPPTPAANSPVSVPQPAPQAVPAQTTEQPAVADGAPAPAVSQPAAPQPEIVAQPAGAPGGSDWYVWLLLPMFLAGAYLLSRSLEEEAVLAASSSGGAMTRLLERQAATRAPDLVGR